MNGHIILVYWEQRIGQPITIITLRRGSARLNPLLLYVTSMLQGRRIAIAESVALCGPEFSAALLLLLLPPLMVTVLPISPATGILIRANGVVKHGAAAAW